MVQNYMQPAGRKDLTGRTNEKTMNMINSVGSVQIKTHLGRLLEERKLSQADLAEITGIGPNMISAFVNNRANAKIGYGHIYAIMIALRITDISEFMYVEFDNETIEKFAVESAEWKETKVAPAEIRNLYM